MGSKDIIGGKVYILLLPPHPFYDFDVFFLYLYHVPSGSVGKESACNAGDPGSIPGSGTSPGEGDGNPLQCSCLENSMDSHGVIKSRTRVGPADGARLPWSQLEG